MLFQFAQRLGGFRIDHRLVPLDAGQWLHRQLIEILVDALTKVQYPVIRSTPFDAKPADLIRAAQELELEGIIAKRKDSLYEPGRRSGAWLKYKIARSQEFVIGGYTAGNPYLRRAYRGMLRRRGPEFCRQNPQWICAARSPRSFQKFALP